LLLFNSLLELETLVPGMAVYDVVTGGQDGQALVTVVYTVYVDGDGNAVAGDGGMWLDVRLVEEKSVA